jgi:DNA-binding MarR family transcriptional regulator
LRKENQMAKTIYQSDLTIDEKVLIALVRAAENFKRAHSAIFKDHQLSFPQYNILRVLEATEGGRNKISTIGKIMLVPGANMTGLAKRLEQQGFILREPDPADERVTLLVITKKGRKTLKLIQEDKDRALNMILEDFSDPEKKALLKQIKNIIQRCCDIS